MSPFATNQASLVAGRRQGEYPKATTLCPDLRGATKTSSNTSGCSGSLTPQARENAQYEIEKSHPRRVSALKQAWWFFSGKPSSEPPVHRTKSEYERDPDGWSTIDLTSSTNGDRHRVSQLSHYPEDRRGSVTRVDESQIQSYWNTPFQHERQVLPASHSIRRSYSDDSEPEEALDIDIVAWNPGPRRSVRIVHDDPCRAVRSQVALVVNPSTEDFSSGSDSESFVASACDSSSVLTTHSRDETYGEADEEDIVVQATRMTRVGRASQITLPGLDEQEENIVMQAKRATRVGRATLVKYPELNRNQNEAEQERGTPSIDLADCSVKGDDTQSLSWTGLQMRKSCQRRNKLAI